MRLSDLQTKDIISTKDGRKIGRIVDAEINQNGVILFFLVEPKKILKSITMGNQETTMTFDQINKIGEDVILVDL